MTTQSAADKQVVKDEASAQVRQDTLDSTNAAQASADAATNTKDWRDAISYHADKVRTMVTDTARAALAEAEKEGHSAGTAIGQFYAAQRRDIAKLYHR